MPVPALLPVRRAAMPSRMPPAAKAGVMKLGLRDRVQAVVLAYESGLIRPGG